MEVFTDRMDINSKISLYEYQIIRNPKTNKCVICTNTHELDSSFGDLIEESIKPKVRVEYITLNDVKKALEETDDGYYSYSGQSKIDVLNKLSNEDLTYYIFSLNQYNGYFQLQE